MAFLEKESHRIRFVFTPKHCSWFNPIENYFAKLQRHAITHGNFTSVKINLTLKKNLTLKLKTTSTTTTLAC